MMRVETETWSARRRNLIGPLLISRWQQS
ncbi:hypothetical protein RB213_001262 [Colletotrichum asianum]